MSHIDLSIIIPIVLGTLVIFFCIAYQITEFIWRRSRSRSSLSRTGGSADIRVMENFHASPPEYEDALNMRQTGVETISGSKLPDVSLSEPPPPSYDSATSGLFPLTLPGGSPTAPRTGAPTNHGDIPGLRDFDSEGQGHHNRAYEPEDGYDMEMIPWPQNSSLATPQENNP